jgi:lambda family phage portal protein
MGKRRKPAKRQPLPAEVNRLAMGESMALGFGGMTGASQMAQSPRFALWRPQSLDADGVAQYELADLRAFSGDLERTAPVATGAIATRVSHIVGTGLSLQSRIDAEELGLSDEEASTWQSFTERRFAMWAGSPYADAHGELDFYEQQELALRSHDVSGDSFVLLSGKSRDGWPFRLATQIIEAHRVSNPDNRSNTSTLVDGVERAEDGEPVRIHVSRYHPGRIISGPSNKWTTVEIRGESGRRNVLHLKKQKRPGQTRGTPILAPIIATIKQLTRYSDAEVDAAVNSAAMALFLTMDAEAFNDILTDDERKKVIASASQWDGAIDSGKAINLMPGESISSPTPGRPNPNFDPFFGAMLNICSMGLNMPKEVLAKAFNASYSASRAALMDAWRTWKIERAWLARRMCQPIYEEWLADAVALGIIQAPGFFSDPFIRAAWCGATWCGDGPGALDPMKEAMAAGKRIELGQTTLAEEIVAYDGGDWEQKHRQRAREVGDRVRDGLQAPIGAAPGAAPVPPPADAATAQQLPLPLGAAPPDSAAAAPLPSVATLTP